jgi:hypothetical protein
VSTKLARFTQSACPALERCAESTARRRLPHVRSRQGAGPLPCSTVNDSGWEPDGVTLQVRFCEEPGTNRRMAEILRHRRETRRQTDKANVCLNVGKDPAYFPKNGPYMVRFSGPFALFSLAPGPFLSPTLGPLGAGGAVSVLTTATPQPIVSGVLRLLSAGQAAHADQG